MSIRQHLWIPSNAKEIQTTAWGSLLRAGFDELEKKKQETTQGKSDHTGSNSTPHHSLEIGAFSLPPDTEIFCHNCFLLLFF